MKWSFFKYIAKKYWYPIRFAKACGKAVKNEVFVRKKQYAEKGINNYRFAFWDLFNVDGDDGLALYITASIKDIPQNFVDIGSGNGIVSNCSALSIHDGWGGLMIDAAKSNHSIGKFFHRLHNKNFKKINWQQAFVTPENINQLIAAYNSAPNEIGLLSIDIDGNDYWIWKAITQLQPWVVIIEARIEFGKENIIVPYGIKNHRDAQPDFHGASVAALVQLAASKNYVLVAANKRGYNLYFVRKDKMNDMLKEIAVEEVMGNIAN